MYLEVVDGKGLFSLCLLIWLDFSSRSACSTSYESLTKHSNICHPIRLNSTFLLLAIHCSSTESAGKCFCLWSIRLQTGYNVRASFCTLILQRNTPWINQLPLRHRARSCVPGWVHCKVNLSTLFLKRNMKFPGCISFETECTAFRSQGDVRVTLPNRMFFL